MNAETVIHRFVDAINAHDIDAIYDLMTDDHCFIDTGGSVVEGRDEMNKSWIGYFNMVPDYKIKISEVLLAEATVILLGIASGTYTTDGILKSENFWETPAAWRAEVEEDKVSEWQIYADNEPIRKIMRKEGTLRDE